MARHANKLGFYVISLRQNPQRLVTFARVAMAGAGGFLWASGLSGLGESIDEI